jgi:hypothetical protein
MEDNIRRANEECDGLTKALSKFTKGSREYTMIKLKLDVAKDELACMKEDYDMFANFATIVGDGDDETMLQNKNYLNHDLFLPSRLEDTNDAVVGMSPTSVVSGILTPPLRTNNLDHPPLLDKKSSRSCHGSLLSKEDGSNNANDRHEVSDTKDLMMILVGGVQKYSVEWFTIKLVMNKLSQMKERSIRSSKIETMIEDASRKISKSCDFREGVKNELFTRLRRLQEQQQQQQQIPPIVENKITSGDEIGIAAVTINEQDITTKARSRRKQQKKGKSVEESNLTLLLDEVPKYSLEWFQIRTLNQKQ